jgi:hypothetical protein
MAQSQALDHNARLCAAGRDRAGPARADTYTQSDVLSVEQSIVGHVEYTLARSRYKFDDQEAYQATSLSLRDRLIESWNDTHQYFKCAAPGPPGCWAQRLVRGSLRGAAPGVAADSVEEAAFISCARARLTPPMLDRAMGDGEGCRAHATLDH